MLLFMISVWFHVDETNATQLERLSFSAHALLLLGSSSYLETNTDWKRVRHEFEPERRVIHADIDCSSHIKICREYVKDSDLPSLIRLSARRAQKLAISLDYESLANYSRRLVQARTIGACLRYPTDCHSYPAFVFHYNAASTCSAIRNVARYLPEQAFQMYFANDSDTLFLEAHLSEAHQVRFTGRRLTRSYVDFIAEYALETLGDWDFHQAFAFHRRVGFVVYANASVIPPFRVFLQDYIDRAIFGKFTLAGFRRYFPSVPLVNSDLPALGIANRRGRFLVLKGVDVADPSFVLKFNEAIAGGLDGAMRNSLVGFGRASRAEADTDTLPYLATISLATIVITIAFIVRHAQPCLKHRKKTPFALL
jgi:hypothetical protein